MVGAVLFVVVGGPMAVQSSKDGRAAVVWIGILAMGAFVGGLSALAGGARNRTVTAVSSVVGGLVVGAGGVMLVALLLCMSIAAAFASVCNGGHP
jgi:hypothetical protein